MSPPPPLPKLKEERKKKEKKEEKKEEKKDEKKPKPDEPTPIKRNAA